MNEIQAHPLSRMVYDSFVSCFGHTPSFLLHAPGRINVIGEHTDYNGGFVLPGAIPQGIFFAFAPAADDTHHWYAMDTEEHLRLPADTDAAADRGWGDYFLGAYDRIRRDYGILGGMHCVFTSDLPAGAGLSSSSALTCGFLLGLDGVLGLGLERSHMAWLAHLVEKEFIGLQGGIMDQHACLLSKPDHLLLLDCKDRSFRYIPLPQEAGIGFFLINTRVQHKLTDSEYNTRAAECRRALELLREAIGINSLRDIDAGQLTEHEALLGPLLMKRVGYVLEENARVHAVEESIARQDWPRLGTLLSAGHVGLRDKYEVSCAELDFLVDIVAESADVYGGRMMGGGFGGCTIHVAMPGAFGVEFRREVGARYTARFGREPGFIDVRLAAGAQIWRPDK